jgi:hypothetical protein
MNREAKLPRLEQRYAGDRGEIHLSFSGPGRRRRTS